MLRSIKYKITIYVLIGLILGAALGFAVYFFIAQARDYQRLADLKVWQDILSSYYSQNGTYIIPNCKIGEILSQCLIKTVGRQTINNINDPVNVSPYQYTVASLSETDYEIRFALEAGIAGLKPGQYVWTKNGVRK